MSGIKPMERYYWLSDGRAARTLFMWGDMWSTDRRAVVLRNFHGYGLTLQAEDGDIVNVHIGGLRRHKCPGPEVLCVNCRCGRDPYPYSYTYNGRSYGYGQHGNGTYGCEGCTDPACEAHTTGCPCEDDGRDHVYEKLPPPACPNCPGMKDYPPIPLGVQAAPRARSAVGWPS